MQLVRLCLLLVICTAALCSGQQMPQQYNPDLCPPVEIPASTNVTDLTELTFWGRIADGRVWMVEFYADFCRGCKRIASHVSMLADSLAATHPDIVVGRINCEQQEYFCAHVIKISRTPSFKVYYQGKKAMDYNVDFFFFDTAQVFITDIAANLKGFSLPSSKPQDSRSKAGAKDDDYDDDNGDDDYE